MMITSSFLTMPRYILPASLMPFLLSTCHSNHPLPMQLIGFAQKKVVMAPSLKYPYKMVNWLMAPHSHSIFWQTIHKLAYSRAWRLSSRNTVHTKVYCQILCSFMHNVSSSNMHQAMQIVAVSGSSLMNQILLHKNQSLRNSLNHMATIWYSIWSFTAKWALLSSAGDLWSVFIMSFLPHPPNQILRGMSSVP